MARPVGESKEWEVDVRVIAATHRDLRERVATKYFREDLFDRLDVVTVALPSLWARAEDIPPLVDHFLRAARAKYPGSPVTRVSAEAMARLCAYRFPGNVRELAHLIERGVLFGGATELTLADLPPAVLAGCSPAPAPLHGEVLPVREVRRRYATWALEQLGGNRTRTAERLGIDTNTLARWLVDDQDETKG